MCIFFLLDIGGTVSTSGSATSAGASSTGTGDSSQASSSSSSSSSSAIRFEARVGLLSSAIAALVLWTAL